MEVQLKETFDTVRLPLVQELNDIHQSGNSSATWGLLYQHYLNCFPNVSKDDLSNQGEVWVSKRNGFYTSIDISSLLGSSTSNWATDNITFSQLANTYCAVIFDQTNSKHVIIAYDGSNNLIKIGEITGTASDDHVFLSELTIENVPTLGVVWHDTETFTSLSKGYYASVDSGTGLFTTNSLTEITDTDFPPNQVVSPALALRGPMIQIDGTTYVLTLDGQIFGSDLNSITDWNALNVIRAIQYPDRGVSLARYKHHLVVFGEDSIEFFNDVGNPAPSSPLERTQQAFIKFGAAGPRQIVSIGDTIYWMESSSSETSSLWRLDGYTPVKVSNDAIENIMGTGVNELRSIIFMNNQCLITDCMVDLGAENTANKHGSTYVDGCATSSLFATDPTGAFNDEFSKCLLAYNIESKSWWYFKHPYASALQSTFMPIAAIHASSAVLSNLGQTSYVLFKNLYPITELSLADEVYSLLSATQGISGHFKDEMVVDSVFETWPITCSIATNTHTFNTEKLKRIHKLKIIQRIFQPSFAGDYPYIWLLYVKDDWTLLTDSANNKRMYFRTLVPSQDAIRYYINKLGSGRQWGFCLVSRSSIAWQVKGLELDMSSGTR